MVRPTFDTTDGSLQPVLIEYGCYSVIWLLMLISHIMTMCVDPGFIPKQYSYDESVLAAPFSSLAAAEQAIRNRQRVRSDAIVDDEERLRSLSMENSSKRTIRGAVHQTGSQTQVLEMSGVIPKIRAEQALKKQAFDNSLKESGLSLKELTAIQHKMGKKCNKCNCVKPPRTHHCSTCGRCVLKMDHHCPWMNNCIGLRNTKAFLLFNFYTMIAAAWTAVRVGIAMIKCTRDDACDTFSGIFIVFAVIMLFFCGLFTIFCAVMFCDQYRMIVQDTSTIDRKMAARNRA